MALFVTLEQVKARLRLTSTDEDADLQDMVDQAEARIVEWCTTSPRSQAIVNGWVADPSTVPDTVVLAILVQVGELNRFRGDDTDGPKRDGGEELNTAVRELLRRYHDPVVA